MPHGGIAALVLQTKDRGFWSIVRVDDTTLGGISVGGISVEGNVRAGHILNVKGLEGCNDNGQGCGIIPVTNVTGGESEEIKGIEASNDAFRVAFIHDVYSYRYIPGYGTRVRGIQTPALRASSKGSGSMASGYREELPHPVGYGDGKLRAIREFHGARVLKKKGLGI